MLDRIIAFALEHRVAVALLALAVAALGGVTAAGLPIDVLPDLNRPTVTVLTEAHGLVPEDIERLVTRPIEQAVNGAPGIWRVRSSSGMGLSAVYAEFEWGTDLLRNRQVVQERLTSAAANLPPGVVPHMAPVSSLMGQIQLVGIRSRSGRTDPTAVRAWADQVLRLRLLSVPGVAQVITTGGAPRQIEATVDADRLAAAEVTLAEVAAALRAANEAGSGGVLPLGTRGPLVSVTGRATSDEALGRAVVRDDPRRPVLVADVATVRFAPAAVRTGSAGVDGREGVVAVVLKQPETDTIALTRRIQDELALLARTAPADLEVLPEIYRQADFIQRAVDNVSEAVRDGAILVLLVLFLFLLNARTTLITLTAIPLSVAVTALVFHLAGISINTMTLGGLAVAIGALVDDAIVDVENVFRRLRENRRMAVRRAPLAIVFLASSEVRKPILIGTVLVAAVYLPLFALGGMEGRLFTPIGITYIVSISASLLVALTVTPVLCAWLLPRAAARAAGRDPWAVRALQRGADALIRGSLRHPVAVAGGLGALCVIALGLLSLRGTEFLPPFNEGSAQVNLVLPPGTGLHTSEQFGRRLERVVLEVPGVAHAARRTGRAEGDEHTMDVNVTEMVVSFDPASRRPREAVLGDIRAALRREFPGVTTMTEQPLAHLLSHMLSGVYAQVAIKVEGEDLGVLRRLAREVGERVRGVPGVADLYVESQQLVPRVEVAPRRDVLAAYGVPVEALSRTLEWAMEGEEVTRAQVGAWAYPVVLRLAAKDRSSLDAVRALRVRAPSGEALALGDLADVRLGLTPNNVERENLTRRIVVQHNVQGRSLGEVVADVERALEPLRAKLPAGYVIRLGGQFEAQERAARVIVWLSFASLGLMFLVLWGHFGSVNLTLQVLLNIPAAFLGAAVLLLVTGQTLSIATLVGFVALGGVASRNGILLLDHYLHLMREEGAAFGPELIRRAGRERIVPVVMTALTSGIALVPLFLSPGEPGRELLYPVATVILGGLVSSTLLDVLLTPGVFHLFGRRSAERARDRRDPQALAAAQRALAFDDPPPTENPR